MIIKYENLGVRSSYGLDNWTLDDFISDHNSVFYTKTVNGPKGKKIRIVTCYTNQNTIFDTSIMTTKLIYHYRPRYLFMTGLVCGIDHTEVGFGDILIASEIWDGTNIDNFDKGQSYYYLKSQRIPLGFNAISLLSKLSNSKELLFNIEKKYINEFEKPRSILQAHICPIVSVPFERLDNMQTESLKSLSRKILGVDNASYGMFYSANNCYKRKPIFTILVKSVSDFFDAYKHDHYQQYALYTSTEFIKYIVLNELDYSF